MIEAPVDGIWIRDIAPIPSHSFASYLNAYVANGAVIGARFGDPEREEAARRALVRAFPERKVVMLRIDNIVDGGGGFIT